MTVPSGPVPVAARPNHGGAAARRAVRRWSWRLFRLEWRQQLLVLALVVVAVAATTVGATVAVGAQVPADTGFGTAHDMATLSGTPGHVAAEEAALRHRVGRVDMITNEQQRVPGSTDTYDLRAQDPGGPFGSPMLALRSGRFPAHPGEVALTPGLAAELHLHPGDTWHDGTATRRVVGLVVNPQNLVDAFALVVPGSVTTPTSVTVLFDAPLSVVGALTVPVSVVGRGVYANVLNPETIVLALATLGMLLIALVAVGGFTVLAQRRLRSLGLLASLGASRRHVAMVVRANGAAVGVAGAVGGFVLGLAAWLAARPMVENSAHHVIGVWALPWAVVVPAMALAVVATWAASARPARAVARVPVVDALAGRPAPPAPVHRTALPGLVTLVIAFFLFGASGAAAGQGGGMPEMVLGLVVLVAAIVLLAPLCLSVLGAVARRAPVGMRLALRDLARYRSRAGAALAAITLGVLIATIVAVAAAARYGNSLDYVGPNLATNQLVLSPAPVGVPAPDATKGGPGSPLGLPGPPPGPTPAQVRAEDAAMATSAHQLATQFGSGTTALELDGSSATLVHTGPGRTFTGTVYVATPQLLQAFGIAPSTIDPAADVLTSRPGLSGVSGLRLVAGEDSPIAGPGPIGAPPGSDGHPSCSPPSCLAHPVIQEVAALPTGTAAPNVVLTEHAVRILHLHPTAAAWLVQAPQPLTAAQVSAARLAAGAAGLQVETKNDEPTGATIIDGATIFGIVLALGVLAMAVGLLRSETAGDLRTLAATGASTRSRRVIVATTAGALAAVGAVVGTAAGYLAVAGWLRSNRLDGLSALTSVPLANLLVILVGLPVLAAAGGWLVAGRRPSGLARPVTA